MKKQKILKAINKPGRHTTGNFITSKVFDIDGVKHLITDLYENGNLTYRIALNDTEYAHFSYETETWDKKALWNWNNEKRYVLSKAESNHASLKRVKAFCKSKKSISEFAMIENYETELINKKEKKKDEKKKDEMQELFDLLPPEEDISKEIERRNDKSNMIFYKRRGRYADMMCAQCGQGYTVDTEGGIARLPHPVPRRNQWDTCVLCGKNGKLETEGRHRYTDYYDSFYSLVYQVCADGKLVVRGYRTSTYRGYGYEMRTKTVERYRLFVEPGLERQYHNSYDRWHSGKEEWIIPVEEYGSVRIAESKMKYIPEEMVNTNTWERLDWLRTYANCPQIETLWKVGLKGLCRRIKATDGKTKIIDKKETRLLDILKCNKSEYEYLLTENTGTAMDVIRFAQKRGYGAEEYESIKSMIGQYWFVENEKLLLRHQKPSTLLNYIREQVKQGHYTGNYSAITEYKDYLRLRRAREDHFDNSKVLHPKNLHRTYAVLREKEERLKKEQYLVDMIAKYPDIAKVSKKIPKKYTWQQDGLMIRPARDTQEVVLEGRELHHCVGDDRQKYMERFNEDKGWILVLRRESAPDTPYVTVEIVGKKIMQWYGEHDTKPDKEQNDKFLKDFVDHLYNKQRKVAG